MGEYNHKALTGGVIGCAMQVHRTLGVGLPEAVYQRSLAVEMQAAGLNFQRELTLPLYYRNEQVGSRRVDFLVADVLLLELKAVTEILPIHHTQIINYLNAYQLEIGLLLNFSSGSLTFKRFIKSY